MDYLQYLGKRHALFTDKTKIVLNLIINGLPSIQKCK